MRNYNGYGSIAKMSGNRRKPYIVRITAGWELDEANQKVKQIQKVLGYYATRQEAIKALADYNDNPYDLDVKTVTFAECYDAVKKEFTDGRKNNYAAAYKFLEPVHDLPIRQIKTNTMQKCIDACQTTQQREIKTVCRKVFEYALRNEIVDKNPALYLHNNNVEATIERNVFTSEEIASILEADTWYKVCLGCLLYTGMRSKELRTLSADDIDLDNMTVNIREGKNKSSVRIIPIHTHADALFQLYKENGIGFYGKTHNGFNKAIRTSFETVHHAHDTRHTFATRMRECGCDPLVLQKILGHTPQTITEKVYTHLTIDEMRQNIELLSY